jgi:methyltransferase family protein
MKKDILRDVSAYYTARAFEHGPTPRGVDWNSRESQVLRFSQLTKLLPNDSDFFTITDSGCGYGAYYDFLKSSFPSFRYVGYDISEKMIQQAVQLHPSNEECSWISDEALLQKTDYLVASGIFNVKLTYSDQEWREYVWKTLHRMNELNLKGMAFNMLTSYSDEHRKRVDLYYADPSSFFDYCKRNFSRYVTLLHDYPLYEFTILVRKETS